MKVIAICVGALVLALAVSGQAVSAPEHQVNALQISRLSDNRVVAKGLVELTIGTTVITADEADIQYGAPGSVSDIRLSGPVHVKAILK